MIKRQRLSEWWRGLVTKTVKWISVGLIVIVIGGLAMGVKGYRAARWGGRERFTIVRWLGDGRSEIASFDPVIKRGVVVEIPAELLVETVGGRGRWTMRQLPTLRAKFGMKWAADSLMDYLGIGYTGEEEGMGWWDKWNWWLWKDRVEWNRISLDGGEIEEVIDIDGERFLRLSTAWPGKAKEWFGSWEVGQEGLGVTVVNTLGVTGMGGHAARWMETAGMKVERLIETGDERVGCLVSTPSDDRNKVGVRLIISQWGCKWQAGDGGVRVELGRDYKKWWLGE